MSKKLLAGAVAGILALTPTVASAAGSHNHPRPRHHQPNPPRRPTGGGHPAGPTADKGRKQPPPPQCIGLIGRCQGYRYTCMTAFYPKQLAVFTNLDATEDWYEAVVIGAAHPWHCYGTPDH